MLVIDVVNEMIKCNSTGIEYITHDIEGRKNFAMHQLRNKSKERIGIKYISESNEFIFVENKELLVKALSNTDVIVVTSALNGIKSTIGISSFFEIAKDMGILTIAVVPKPFNFVSKHYKKIAGEA